MREFSCRSEGVGPFNAPRRRPRGPGAAPQGAGRAPRVPQDLVTPVTRRRGSNRYTTREMASPSFAVSAAEALVLGLSTGPVCLASCGPVVLPWVMVQPRGVRQQSRQMGLFLGARLAGYLAFAMAAWLAGASIPHALPRELSGRSWLLGGVQLLLAAALVWYAVGWPRRRYGFSAPPLRSTSDLVQIGEAPHPRRSGPLALGFLTGVNLCPPFLVAGVRAAQLTDLWAALLFFTLFFVGTAVWFLPFLFLGFVRRTPAIVTVARMVALLLACWYGFSGLSILFERTIYG